MLGLELLRIGPGRVFEALRFGPFTYQELLDCTPKL